MKVSGRKLDFLNLKFNLKLTMAVVQVVQQIYAKRELSVILLFIKSLQYSKAIFQKDSILNNCE